MDTIDSIIESLLQFHGYDANNHPSLEDDLEDEEPSVSNKRRKVQPRQNMNNIELEVNDNEPVISDEGQELDHGEEEEIGAAEHQPEISAYERMRDKNIAERKKKIKELGMLTQSGMRAVTSPVVFSVSCNVIIYKYITIFEQNICYY